MLNNLPRNEHTLLRIAKYIAWCGICSRRNAEKLILEGRVKINNETIKQCNINVSKKDKVYVDGKLLSYKKKVRLWKFNKEVGYLVTNFDPQNRLTIFDKIKYLQKERLIAVGRLDMNSEGLILMTNDGNLARKLELPANKILRKYKVRVHGKVDEKKITPLKKGIMINDVNYRALDVRIIRNQKTNTWLEISIREGKNREIRKVMKFIGYPVNRLIRMSYGPYRLNGMKPSELIEVDLRKININFD